MKSVLSNSLLLSILLFLYLSAFQYLRWTALLLCLLFWYLRTKDNSVFIIAIMLLTLSIPRYSSQYPQFKQGRVAEVHAKYSVIQNGLSRLILYTEAQPTFDSIIRFTGKPYRIESKSGFFTFDFASWCQDRGILYAVTADEYETVSSSFSFRSMIQKQISKIDDERTADGLKTVLLGIRSDEDAFVSFLNDSGFSLSGILVLLNSILKYLLKERERDMTLLSANIVLCVIYHAPLILVQSMIFRILKRFKMERSTSLGLGLTLTMIIFPYAISSASFLIPSCYRISSVMFKDKKTVSICMSMMVQSILFHSINPVQTAAYRLIIPFLGLSWFLALLQVLFPVLPMMSVIVIMDRILSILNLFQMPGSMLGFGLPFFIAVCLLLRRKQYSSKLILSAFLLFQAIGMFHPFAEVTLINVQQGDSILVRLPLNSENYLIDTGKPSQWNALSTMLDAKGIRKLNTLFITHADQDHSGNMQNVIDQYHPEHIVTDHQQMTQNGKLQFLDLNEINDDDENRSSLVHYFSLNGLSYLCMADADSQSERKMIEQYGNLQCEILKLSHHGSKTGSCEEFLDTVKPKIGLISSGPYRIYHHPSPETIQSLLKRHIPYLDTKEQGDISIICFPGLNLLITSSGTISILN